jgi:hypothetical protein
MRMLAASKALAAVVGEDGLNPAYSTTSSTTPAAIAAEHSRRRGPHPFGGLLEEAECRLVDPGPETW